MTRVRRIVCYARDGERKVLTVAGFGERLPKVLPCGNPGEALAGMKWVEAGQQEDGLEVYRQREALGAPGSA